MECSSDCFCVADGSIAACVDVLMLTHAAISMVIIFCFSVLLLFRVLSVCGPINQLFCMILNDLIITCWLSLY